MSAFDRIIGYRSEKDELIRLCDVLKHPDKYQKLGVRFPSAILLYGDPGLGKTLFAKALIEESGLPCFPCRKDSSDGHFVEAIKKTFEKAAENAPSIIFLDDMDKFAEDNLRKDSNKEEFATIQSCMEKVQDKQVFVIATANDIDYLPESLLRAGRFGRNIKFNSPSDEDAAEIIRYYLHGKPISKDLSAETIAKILYKKSCATLEEIVNEAGILAGHENSVEISRDHILRAILKVLFNIIPTTDLAVSRKRLFISYHEAGHAVVALALGQKVGIVTSHKGAKLEGVCTEQPLDSTYLTFNDVLRDSTVSLGGKAAVALHFGEADVGCSKDIDDAVQIIRPAITRTCAVGFEYGHDHDLGFEFQQPPVLIDRISNKLYKIVEMCYNNALQILERNKELLEAIAAELQKRPALLSDDLDRILSEHPIRKE